MTAAGGLRACVAAAALALASLPGSALARAPDGLVLEYRVLRGGGEVGRHRVRFDHQGGALTVETEVRITVTFAFITLFRYALDARETWRDGRLVALESSTDDDGDRYTVRAVAEGDAIVVEAGTESWTAPATVSPSSLWHRDMARGSLLIGIEQGDRIEVAFSELGRETVTAWGVEVSATHVVASGGLERELWYDDDGILVHLRLVARDGSDIVYVLD